MTENLIHMTTPNRGKKCTYREPKNATNYNLYNWGAISLFVDIAAKIKFHVNVPRSEIGEDEIRCLHEVTIASIGVSTGASVVETLLEVSVGLSLL